MQVFSIRVEESHCGSRVMPKVSASALRFGSPPTDQVDRLDLVPISHDG